MGKRGIEVGDILALRALTTYQHIEELKRTNDVKYSFSQKKLSNHAHLPLI